VLKKWFYEFEEDDRIQVYLTNTLDPFETHGHIPFFRELTEESKIADDVKLKKPILVVLGNPPYSVSSSNKSQWILEKMQDYKRNLNERNIRPLSDDYIKFIRFAQWKIEQNERGIIGIITNNRYLDGIIHRQIRKSLFNAFNRIYILNLHGSSRRTIETEGMQKDENVFDIQQGVAITIFIKNNKFNDKKIFYTDLYGDRQYKYSWLDRTILNAVEWLEIVPQAPYYFFIPKDTSLQKQYNDFQALNEIFNIQSVGVKTSRDDFVVAFSALDLENNMSLFNSNETDEYVMDYFHLKNTGDWNLKEARDQFKKIDYAKYVKKYAYRPFDIRLICYSKILVDRPREAFMHNFDYPNLSLITSRLLSGNEYNHAVVTQNITDMSLLSTKSESIPIFPLYIYDDRSRDVTQFGLDSNIANSEAARLTNFNENFVEFINNLYKNHKIASEEIFSYIYAVLYSPTYRVSFREHLKIDFPRIPFTKDYELFKKLSELGQELVNLHLLKTKLTTITKFDVQGSNIVTSVKYTDQRAYINKTQYFDGIPSNVWDFRLGAYQVLDKWLKSRKNRELGSVEIELRQCRDRTFPTSC